MSGLSDALARLAGRIGCEAPAFVEESPAVGRVTVLQPARPADPIAGIDPTRPPTLHEALTRLGLEVGGGAAALELPEDEEEPSRSKRLDGGCWDFGPRGGPMIRMLPLRRRMALLDCLRWRRRMRRANDPDGIRLLRLHLRGVQYRLLLARVGRTHRAAMVAGGFDPGHPEISERMKHQVAAYDRHVDGIVARLDAGIAASRETVAPPVDQESAGIIARLIAMAPGTSPAQSPP